MLKVPLIYNQSMKKRKMNKIIRLKLLSYSKT